MTLDEALAAVIADQVAWGATVQPGADPEAIAAVRDALAREFGAALPDAYATLLARCDGLEHDGLVLYGCRSGAGLVDMNRVWREAPGRDRLLVLGDTDMDLFAVALDGTGPCLVDKVGGDVAETYPDVPTALVELLAARL